MSEFVGRTGSQRLHSYPLPPRAPAGAGPFARNFAVGPLTDLAVPAGAGAFVPWSSIDVGPASTEVLITPVTTGVIRISAVLSFQIDTEATIPVGIQVQVNDVALPVPFNENDLVDQFTATPILAQKSGLAIGVAAKVRILMVAASAPGVLLSSLSSTLEVQEVPVSTG